MSRLLHALPLLLVATGCSEPFNPLGRGTDADGDGSYEEQDCDDENPAVYPDANEICDDLDNDCDGEVDNDAVDVGTWYPDSDGDGYGYDEGGYFVGCEPAAGFADNGDDCNESSATIHPGAEEICDGLDNDCDGVVDGEGTAGASTWYPDSDGDGFGATGEGEVSCEALEDRVLDDSDCDDDDELVNPEALELCDGVDNDCDGSTDEGDASDALTWYADADGDGYGDPHSTTSACELPEGYTTDTSDCDDSSAASHPGADEYCDDADNDCDGSVDEDPVDPLTWYLDADGDAYGDPDSTASACEPPAGYYADSGDCDDTDATVNPAATEVCDGVDNDCDGSADGSDATDANTWYTDADGDGYGDASSSSVACDAPSGTSADSSDCDDTEASVYPSASETCDGLDNDCDGTVDEDATDVSEWFTDSDGDGYGDDATSTIACTAPSGSIALGGDCDDTDASINPAASEVCDGVDNDCDGSADGADAPGSSDFYADADSDGYGDASTLTTTCTAPSGYITDASDCDDTDSTIYPGASEICDGQQNDCDMVAWSSSSEDGKVTWYDTAGNGTDITATFTTGSAGSPSTYTLPISGELLLCDGTYYTLLELRAAGSLTISSLNGSADTILDSQAAGSVIGIHTAGSVVDISGFTITGGSATDGGALYSEDSDLTLSDCIVRDNQASDEGGAFYVDGGSLYLLDSHVLDNSASDSGGALYLAAGSVTVVDSEISDNSASLAGGGLYLAGSSVTAVSLDGTTMSGNHAGTSGGAVYATSAPVDLVDTLLQENQAFQGAGLYLTGSAAATCMGSSSATSGLLTNTAIFGGGGVYLASSSASLESDTCDWGASGGSDDNSPDDVGTASSDWSFGDDASFTCSSSSCS